VTKGDLLVERGARRLQELADKAAARGDGVGTWLSEELRNDAAFLRKLKPSLVKARARGETPRSDAAPTTDTEASMAEPPKTEAPIAQAPAAAPPPPPPPPRPSSFEPKQKTKAKRGGPPPIVIVGAAFVAGIVLAKVVDWRGHAHPRD
jgi:hypothetical protein